MEIDFKSLALKFVIENGCACSTPVELVEQAMRIGAAEGIAASNKVFSGLLEDIQRQRRNNVGTQIIKPIQIEQT